MRSTISWATPIVRAGADSLRQGALGSVGLLAVTLFAVAQGCGSSETDDRPAVSAADAGDADAAGDAGNAAEAGDALDASDGEPAAEAGDGGSTSCTVEGIVGSCTDVAACATGITRPAGCSGSSREVCCLDTEPATPRCPETRTPTVNDGFTTEPAGLDGCPAGMARVGSVCVDRWEASLVVDPGGASWSPYRKPDGSALRAVSVPDAYPQAYVSQLDAVSACALAGKRLCSDDEWRLACEGAGGRRFPYGSTVIDGACNDEAGRTEHPAVACFRSSDASVFSHLDDPGIDQAPQALASAGSRTACATPERVFDLVGNLNEWTSDPAGTYRGGFFADTRLNGAGCAYVTTAHDTSYRDYSTGFRCCADAP